MKISFEIVTCTKIKNTLKLLVISSAPIVQKDNQNHLYTPYEKEMQLWAKHTDSIQFCCPIWKEDRKLLIAPISFEVEAIHEIQEFDSTSSVFPQAASKNIDNNNITIILNLFIFPPIPFI